MLKDQLIFIAICIFVLYQSGSFHIIDYGYIGVYKRGGALLDTWTEPGLHFLIPFITTFSAVQVTLQTDQVTNIPVFFLKDLVWNEQWSYTEFREDRGC